MYFNILLLLIFPFSQFEKVYIHVQQQQQHQQKNSNSYVYMQGLFKLLITCSITKCPFLRSKMSYSPLKSPKTPAI